MGTRESPSLDRGMVEIMFQKLSATIVERRSPKKILSSNR